MGFVSRLIGFVLDDQAALDDTGQRPLEVCLT